MLYTCPLPANFRFLLLTFPQAAFGIHLHFVAEEVTCINICTDLVALFLDSTINLQQSDVDDSFDHNEIQVPLQECCATQDNDGVNS